MNWNLSMNDVITSSFAGMIGYAATPSHLFGYLLGWNSLLLITAPSILLIEAPKTLLIEAPKSEVFVFYTEYDKGLRCLVLYLINLNLDSHIDLLKGIFKAITSNKSFIELGMLKDELKGQQIKEAYFLGPKKYGYYIIDNEGNRKDFSVFSGVPRNSLTFEEVKSIFEGQVITKEIPNRFYKSFKSLNITIKDTTILVKNTSFKQLINNVYLPPKIFNGFHNTFEMLFNKFKKLIIKIIKKLNIPH